MKRHPVRVALVISFAVISSQAAVPWHHPLYLANQGVWPQRVAVTIRNDSPKPVAGEPIEVLLSALAGARVESLRVCREDGVELLFDLRDVQGRPRRTGVLSGDDRLAIPMECAAMTSTTVFVYAGNEEAWAVPDFLHGGFVNGGFESGDALPEGWMPVSADAQHTLRWEKSGGRTGPHCANAEVKAGAAATWVQWQQGPIALRPGRLYELHGWVRGDEVAGSAGWYIHVNGEQPQLINRTLNAGQGTFDWKQVSATFTTPTNAKTAVIGTVLHGTGRAWFDDVELVPADGQPALRVSVGEVEWLKLRMQNRAKFKPGPAWRNRADVVARNFSEEAASPALIRIHLLFALARLPGVPREATMRVLTAEGSLVPVFRLGSGEDLLMAAELPPRAEQWFHVGFSPEARSDDSMTRRDYERLLASPANLVRNGSFERGDDAPEYFDPPPHGGANRVTARFSQDAKFGGRSLELSVGANARADWIGWHAQPIAVKPGATYLLSGWLKGVGLKSTATIHAHFHDARGALCKSGAMVSTGTGVMGDSDWVSSMGFLTAPPDAATLRLHLTMNTEGTLRHDGLILCEVIDGIIDRVHSAAGDAPPRDEPFHVWQVNPLVKVFPDTPPHSSVRRVALELARNEYEPFQLALRGHFGAAMDGVEVSASSLTNAAGGMLPPVGIDRVGFVPVDHPSGYFTTEVPDWCRKVPQGSGRTDGWAGWWPDPLVPGGVFDIATNQTQPVWFTVRAPLDAKPGEYRGGISIRAKAGRSVHMPLSVTVLPFALPEKTRLRAIFDFRRGPGGWHGPDARSPEERARWLRFMAAHRLGIDKIDPPPRFTYRDGKVTMDATEFDATARLCFDELGMNVSYTPDFFYMFGWAYPPKRLFGLEPFTPEWSHAFRQAYGLFTDHLRDQGWHDKFVYYIADEPHFNQEFVVEQMKQLCGLIHGVDAKIPIYSSTWRHCAAWDDSLDIWGVGQYGCFPVPEMERLEQAGRRMWFTCDGQMATDTPYLATERLLPYYCFKYGVEGFEFWGLSWWTYDPWKLGWHWFIRQSDDGKRHYWIRYPDGDGYLAYPGKAVGVDGPVSTIRLEQVREGLEDYEAMAMLAEMAEKARKAGQPVDAVNRALAQARELVTIPNAGGLRSSELLPEPDQLQAIRRAVNATLVDLMR